MEAEPLNQHEIQHHYPEEAVLTRIQVTTGLISIGVLGYAVVNFPDLKSSIVGTVGVGLFATATKAKHLFKNSFNRNLDNRDEV